MEKRFSPVHRAYLDVLRTVLLRTLRRTDASPLMLARVNFENFIENVQTLEREMTEESATALAD
jgi:hypothetical protein